jgi:hypothetical protein
MGGFFWPQRNAESAKMKMGNGNRDDGFLNPIFFALFEMQRISGPFFA